MSEPKTTDPMVLEGKRRVNIMVMVGREVDPLAVEPDPVLFEMVLVQSGYRFDDKSTVRVMLGEAQHELITGGFEAGTRLEEDWAAREKAARAILEQIRRHDVMVVEGVSETGIRSTDRYSLLGFSKAYQAMVRECPG